MKRCFLLCLALVAPAIAAPDGKVTGLNAPVFQILKATHPTYWYEPQARAVISLVWKDGKLDPSEADLLQELATEGTTPQPVLVTSEEADQPLSRNTATKAVAMLFRLAQLPAALRSPGWDDQMSDLVSYANASPDQEGQVVALLTLDLGHHYRQSNFANSYRPFKLRLQKLHEKMQALEGAQATLGAHLLYKGAAQLDRINDDNLQDFLYKYVEPKN